MDATTPRRDVLLPFAGLLLGMFMGALDQTVMASALPTVAGNLGGLSQLPWIVTVYVLGAAATTPIWGKLSDLYGRRNLLRITIVVFLAGSALSGAAQSIGELIAFRALQGVGAGGVMTLATAAVGDLVSPRERGRYQGYIQLVFVLASVAGPLLGGVFVDQLSWRWVFYLNLPVGAVALALIGAYFHVPSQRRPGRIDFSGAALLAGAVVALLLVTTWAGDRYPWGSAQVTGLIAAAAVLGAAFVWRERTAAEPVLPLGLFRDRVFVVVSAALFVATLSLFAALVFLPLFLQLVTGASAIQSGLLMLPLLLASAASTIGAGRIMTATGRYKVFPAVGLALMGVGLALFSTLGTTSSRGVAAAFMVVFGIGFGMVTQVLVVAIQNAVPRAQIGIATASANLFRALGGAVGVAIYGALFTSGLRHWLPRLLPGRLPRGVDPHGIQASPGLIHAFPAPVRHGIAHAVANSVHTVFLVAAPIAAAGFLLVLFLRELPLRGRDSSQTKEPTMQTHDDGSREQVRDLGRRWAQAQERGDAEGLDRMLTDDFMLVGPLGYVLTKQQWLDQYRSGKLVATSVEWDEVDIRDYGSVAVAVGRERQRAEYAGNPANGQFRVTQVAVRRDAGWALAGLHFSPIAPRP